MRRHTKARPKPPNVFTFFFLHYILSTMASHSVYLYRHIQTQQVLLDSAGRPVRLRKDLWRPLVALTGFSSSQSAQSVSDALLQRSKAYQVDMKTDAEHLQRPKRLRQVDEKDMVANSVTSLREALETVKKPMDKEQLLALWEQPHFVDLAGDKPWPAFVQHGQLELRNNRFVKDTEETQ
ncbi:hypothetical protein BC940DRAFT_247270 [Gongronella butleri]|nr:hypothetical protein BC940DRAFT_247270 [Gongronella butleri]